MQPIHDFGGNGPVINLAIANGFPPQTYAPFVAPLTAHYRVVCLLPRPLWGEPPPSKHLNWRELIAADLINGLREHDLRDVILVGHSFGGVASMIAALESPPERVRSLVLLDPTILPAPFNWVLRFSQLVSDGSLGNPMARLAEQRQDHFESRDAVYEKFRTKRLFADWHDDALRAYADSMIPADDGGVRLAWSKAWEAYIFKTFYTGSWGVVPKLRGRLPVLAIRGGESRTFQPAAAQRMRRLLPEMTYAEVAGHGHLFPQSAPDETRRLITDWLLRGDE